MCVVRLNRIFASQFSQPNERKEKISLSLTNENAASISVVSFAVAGMTQVILCVSYVLFMFVGD